MKPVRNRIFCMKCQRAKMLFESKSKAINFIKFNSEEIKSDNGVAPIRVYFCKSCGGWHVTSRGRSVTERGKIKNLIGKAYRLIGEKNWIPAQRFLCYAMNNLRMVNERLITSPVDEQLKHEISKAKKTLDKIVAAHKEKQSSLGPSPIFKYTDMNYNTMELEAETISIDTENEGILYAVRPALLTQYNHKYYYMICTCRLFDKELHITQNKNGLDDVDDSIQTIMLHSLNMVEIKHTIEDIAKNQYEHVEDIFQGEVTEKWISGTKLRVAERVKKSSQFIYNKRSHFDYWIKIGDRNVHFYLGKSFKYTCYVSTNPLDTTKPFYVYAKMHAQKTTEN